MRDAGTRSVEKQNQAIDHFSLSRRHSSLKGSGQIIPIPVWDGVVKPLLERSWKAIAFIYSKPRDPRSLLTRYRWRDTFSHILVHDMKPSEQRPSELNS